MSPKDHGHNEFQESSEKCQLYHGIDGIVSNLNLPQAKNASDFIASVPKRLTNYAITVLLALFKNLNQLRASVTFDEKLNTQRYDAQ